MPEIPQYIKTVKEQMEGHLGNHKIHAYDVCGRAQDYPRYIRYHCCKINEDNLKTHGYDFHLTLVPHMLIMSGDLRFCCWSGGMDTLALLDRCIDDIDYVASIVPENIRTKDAKKRKVKGESIIPYHGEYLMQYWALHWFITHRKDRANYYVPRGIDHDDPTLRVIPATLS